MYTEQSFTTDKIDLAAVLLTFGAVLCSHMPLEWVDIHPSLQAYLDALHGRIPKPKPLITFNIDFKSAAVKTILEAANATTNEEKFSAAVKGSGLAGELVTALLELHSFAVASACREALEWREFLLERKAAFPDKAKWVQVKGPGAGEFVRFGYGTSEEMRARLLEEINY
jgi:hypothetical protein